MLRRQPRISTGHRRWHKIPPTVISIRSRKRQHTVHALQVGCLCDAIWRLVLMCLRWCCLALQRLGLLPVTQIPALPTQPETAPISQLSAVRGIIYVTLTICWIVFSCFRVFVFSCFRVFVFSPTPLSARCRNFVPLITIHRPLAMECVNTAQSTKAVVIFHDISPSCCWCIIPDISTCHLVALTRFQGHSEMSF